VPVRSPLRHTRAVKDGVCPRCESTDLYAIDEVLIGAPDSVNGVFPFALTAHYGYTGETGFLGMGTQRRTEITVEARVCARCAYTELYAKDLDELANFANEGVGGVRRLRKAK